MAANHQIFEEMYTEKKQSDEVTINENYKMSEKKAIKIKMIIKSQRGF